MLGRFIKNLLSNTTFAISKSQSYLSRFVLPHFVCFEIIHVVLRILLNLLCHLDTLQNYIISKTIYL